MKKSVLFILGLLLVLSLAFFGCSSGMGPDGDGDGGSQPIESLSFNLTGAKALAAGEDASRKADAEDAFQLVKVLDDGSIEPVMEIAEGMDNMWFPDVTFIAKSPVTNDVYVSFEGPIRYWVDGYEDPDTGEWIDGYDQNFGSFLHVTPEGEVYPIITNSDGEPQEGRVRDNSWWGAEDYKPIDFDDNGNIYFVWEYWGSSDSVNVMYQYDPLTKEPLALTAAVEGYYYDQFQVDPSGTYLFVKGQRWSDTTQSTFMRMYPLADMTSPVNVYYSSSSDIWVRGFEVAPDGSFMVLNGWNVRGMNGILKADIIDASTLEYIPMYNSDTNDWFQPIYSEWYDEWAGKTWYEGFFDEIDKWRVRVLATDGTDFIYLNLGDLEWNDTSTTVSSYDYDTGTTIYYTLGEDTWFAADSSDPAQKDETNLTWSDFETNGTPIYKLEWWYWDEDGEHTEYKAIPDEVVDFYNDPANYDDEDFKYNTIYMWDDHWYQDSDDDGEGDVASGALDSDLIMEYIGSYYITDVTFKWVDDASAESFGEDAFVQALADQPYIPEEVWGSKGQGSDYWYFLNQHVVESADTSIAAQTFKDFREANDLGWLNFSDIGNMFFDQQGQLWGVLAGGWWGEGGSDPKPIKLLDANGNRDLEVVNAFSGDDYKPVGFVMKGNHLYFRDAVVDTEGWELGFHKLLRFDITDETVVVEDCLTNVPNNGSLEILDFSIDSADTFLYFTAVSGIEVIGGKIDLNDGFTYTEFDSALRLSNIEVY